DQATDEESNDSDSQAEVEKNPEPGVAERKVDPSWDSVGTSQDAPAATYKKGSTDWNEMLKAVGEGSGISPSNMTVWRLGNNGGVGKAVATVSPKGNSSTKYRVQIEWVDGEGWKPAVVDKLQ
ncbi:YrrS family protein, partial [Priestia megaterium]